MENRQWYPSRSTIATAIMRGSYLGVGSLLSLVACLMLRCCSLVGQLPLQLSDLMLHARFQLRTMAQAQPQIMSSITYAMCLT